MECVFVLHCGTAYLVYAAEAVGNLDVFFLDDDEQRDLPTPVIVVEFVGASYSKALRKNNVGRSLLIEG